MEFVVLIGLQASGKTTYRRAHFDSTHAVVSKDHFRNNRRRARRQELLIEEALAAGRSVVVDNTNPSVEERAALISQARRFSARVVGYYFSCTVEGATERNRLRFGRERVPDVGILSTAKAMRRPSLAEGFDELYYAKLEATGAFTVMPFVGETT